VTAAYNVFTDPAVAVDNGGPLDAVEAWERATGTGWHTADVVDAGNRLAAEVGRLRTWVAELEAELARPGEPTSASDCG
jgi:hypothetical protein